MANNIRPTLVETFDSTKQNPYTLSVGQTAQGNISNTLDYDYYSVGVIAGQKYSFGLIGTGISPITDPILRILDSKGNEVASNNDVGTSYYKWSEASYTATQTANLTIEVGSYLSDPGGQYGLSVSSGNQFNFDYFMGAGAVHSDADSLWGSGNGQAVTVTYGFRQTAASYTSTHAINTFTQLSAAQISAVNLAMSLWSDICGIKFQLVNPNGYTNNATILFGNYYATNDTAGAFARLPGSVTASSGDGDVWFNTTSRGVSTTSLAPGTYSFNTILHEVGHALGLTHPGPYDASSGVKYTYTNDAKFAQDSGQYTLMSYFDNSDGGQGSGIMDSNVTPMMLDILAMQNIYGANMSTRTGDSVYGFGNTTGTSIYEFTSSKIPQLCIWDAGGTDTLNCSGFSQNQYINLNEGTFSNIGGGTANISIALNVTIESAVGGSGNDQILGNSANNLFTGGKGDDAIDGGSGIDKAIYSGLASSYIIKVASGSTAITDKTASRDGVDILTNIERIQFADITVALDNGSTQTAGSGYMLYKAAFNRTPDASGLGYWISKMDAGSSYNSVAQSFVNSTEFKTAFGGSNPSVNTLVTKLYNNVLNRTPDSGGLAFWQDKLNTGWSTADVLGFFSTSGENVTNVTPLIANGIQYQQFVG
jgi:serralysin